MWWHAALWWGEGHTAWWWEGHSAGHWWWGALAGSGEGGEGHAAAAAGCCMGMRVNLLFVGGVRRKVDRNRTYVVGDRMRRVDHLAGCQMVGVAFRQDRLEIGISILW